MQFPASSVWMQRLVVSGAASLLLAVGLAPASAAKKPVFNTTGAWAGTYQIRNGASGDLTAQLLGSTTSKTITGSGHVILNQDVPVKVQGSITPQNKVTLKLISGRVTATLTGHLDRETFTISGKFTGKDSLGGKVKGTFTLSENPS